MRQLSSDEPFSRAALWSRRTATFAWATTAVAVLLSRTGTADVVGVFAVLSAGLLCAAFGGGLAVAGLNIIWRTGRRGLGAAATGLILTAALYAYPLWLAMIAFRLPPIADVSTDLVRPPDFLRTLAARTARSGAVPPPSTEEIRRLQRDAYPEIQPMSVEMEPMVAYKTALSIAKELGWKIADSYAPSLRSDGAAHIDAVDKSPLFAFPDDVAIRIASIGEKTRIDVRSVSRRGRHDFGANAKRIRKFLDAFAEVARAK